MSCGHNTCEFFGNATSSSEKVFRDNENRIEYKFPEMIFHYIKKHGYQPPEDFVMFVLKLNISTTYLTNKTNENANEIKCEQI